MSEITTLAHSNPRPPPGGFFTSAFHCVVTRHDHSAGFFTDTCHTMLNKTDKGRAELQPGQRTLGQRERAVLLVADGRQATATLQALFGGLGDGIVRELLAQGYIVEETPPAPVSQPAPEPAPAKGSVDAFSGPRSLASARMFLFDLSERMFAPRDKALALRFREALREARDVSTMLAVSREMLVAIERMAGAGRADAISERLARLLPESTLEDA